MGTRVDELVAPEPQARATVAEGQVWESRAFRERIERELELAARLAEPFAVVGFAGDRRARRLLGRLGEALSQRLRGTDAVGWLGPRELGVLLLCTSTAEARAFAEAVCRSLGEELAAPLRCTVYPYPPEGVGLASGTAR